jgi:two-component system sensor histidine kinase KdpD
VDAQMQAYRRDHAVGKTWPVAERILVCVSPSPLSADLVRAGRRMAARLGAEWIVAYVETPASARLPQADRDRVAQTLRLAEQLGAETATLSGPTMSEEILAYARARNASKIVIGKPGRSLWKRILLGSIVDALVRGSEEIDIYVVSGEGETEPAKPPRSRSRSPDWAAYGLAVGVVAACTATAWAMFHHVGLSNLIMVYLLGVVGIATRTSRGPTVVASVLSVAAFDFFFVPPYFSFAVSDSEYLITFAVMLLVALVISGLTVRIRSQAEAARARERHISSLYGMSRGLATRQSVDSVLETALRHIGEVFPGRLVVLLPDEAGRVMVRRRHPVEFPLDDATELAVAQWVHEHSEAAGLGTATLPGAKALYLPLLGSRGTVGILGVIPAEESPLENPEQLHHLEAFANHMALAIERAQLGEEARRAEVRAETERLRNSLLSSVSHDLRTPLATIIGASSTLVEGDEQLGAVARKELAASIHQEAERLDRLVNNLLEMTRLESGGVTIRKEWQSLEGVIGAALKRFEARLHDRPVHIDLPAELPLVPIDAMLIEQVLINVLDNAIKYTPAGTPIDISAVADGPVMTVTVADRGPGFASGDEERVFRKFYRGAKAIGPGVGLGLAICQAIVEAHGGRMWAEQRPGGGAVLRFMLPLGDAPPPEVPRTDE